MLSRKAVNKKISQRKSASKKAASSKMNHIVTVNVKNGPFSSASQAEQTRKILASKGIRTSEVTKSKGGYIFSSSVSYGTPTISLKNKVIAALKKHSASSGLPKSAISIRSRHL
jgi:hypothetical protein